MRVTVAHYNSGARPRKRAGALMVGSAAFTLRCPMPSALLDRLARGPLLADGAMGTQLYQRGIPFDQSFDGLNLTRATVVESVHRDYLAAGAELIETKTFGCNEVRLAPHELADKVRLIARQGVKVARGAREIVGVNAFVAG